MTNTHTPDGAQVLAATLAAAAATQPNMPLIHAAVEAAHPALDAAGHEEMAVAVAEHWRRAQATVSFPTPRPAPRPRRKAAGPAQAVLVGP